MHFLSNCKKSERRGWSIMRRNYELDGLVWFNVHLGIQQKASVEPEAAILSDNGRQMYS